MSYQDVKTDACGWPDGLPKEERRPIIECARECLTRASRPMELYLVHNYVRRNIDHEKAPTFAKAALLDWTYACVARALRDVALCRWTKEPSIAVTFPDTPAVRAILRQLAAHTSDDIFPFYDEMDSETDARDPANQIPKGETAGSMCDGAQAIVDALTRVLG